jgi:hypothetical protein
MKPLERALAGLGIIGGTWALAQAWFRHPDAFPRLPRSLSERITQLWNEGGLDRLLDAETLLVYLVCAALTGAVVWGLVRWLKR